MNGNFAATYAYFCDDNALQRIDATPETKLANLDRLATLVLEARAEQLKIIAARCPSCGRAR